MRKTWLVSSTPNSCEDGARDGAGRHARGRFARAGPFEDVAQIFARVLQSAGQIRVTRTRARHRGAVRAAGRVGRVGLDAHRVLPVRPVAVSNFERDRTAERLAAAHARENLRAILLDRHPAAASIPQLSSCEIGREIGRTERHAGRNAFNDHDERLTV